MFQSDISLFLLSLIARPSVVLSLHLSIIIGLQCWVWRIIVTYVFWSARQCLPVMAPWWPRLLDKCAALAARALPAPAPHTPHTRPGSLLPQVTNQQPTWGFGATSPHLTSSTYYSPSQGTIMAGQAWTEYFLPNIFTTPESCTESDHEMLLQRSHFFHQNYQPFSLWEGAHYNLV